MLEKSAHMAHWVPHPGYLHRLQPLRLILSLHGCPCLSRTCVTTLCEIPEGQGLRSFRIADQ